MTGTWVLKDTRASRELIVTDTNAYLSGIAQSVQRLATGLDGPGIETRWGREFPHPSRPALRPTLPPIQWVPGLSRGQSGRGVALTTHSPSGAEVERRVELYIYSPSGPSWPVLGLTLPLPLHPRTDMHSLNLATTNVSTPKVWTVTTLASRII